MRSIYIDQMVNTEVTTEVVRKTNSAVLGNKIVSREIVEMIIGVPLIK